MPGRYLDSQWVSYRKKLLDPMQAPPVQVQETRRAFYAGAAALLSVIMQNLTPDHEPTAADLHMMDDIVAELDQFKADVIAGRA